MPSAPELSIRVRSQGLDDTCCNLDLTQLERERQTTAAGLEKSKRELILLFESARDAGFVLDVQQERERKQAKDKRELLFLFRSARDAGFVLDVSTSSLTPVLVDNKPHCETRMAFGKDKDCGEIRTAAMSALGESYPILLGQLNDFADEGCSRNPEDSHANKPQDTSGVPSCLEELNTCNAPHQEPVRPRLSKSSGHGK